MDERIRYCTGYDRRYLYSDVTARPPALGERIIHDGRTYEIYDWERKHGAIYAWCTPLPKPKEN